MPRPVPTLAILLLLVGQGLLATSGLWHRHGPPAQGEPAHAACHHEHQGERPDHDDPEPPAEHDDDCAVCLIVATQRTAVLGQPEVVALASVGSALRRPESQRPASLTRGPPRSRGPPAFNRA